MERKIDTNRKLSNIILKAAGIFILVYAVSLFLWAGYGPYGGIKGVYGTFITTVASYTVAPIKNAKIVDITRTGDKVSVGFIPKKYGVKTILQTTIDVPISNYSFNVPLTIAIMAAFFPFVTRKRIYADALAILVFVHLLFVFSLEGEKLTTAFTTQGYEKQSNFTQIFWEFLWGFVDNMVLRFEPFLIGAYLFFFRNRQPEKKETTDTAKPKRTKKKRKRSR